MIWELKQQKSRNPCNTEWIKWRRHSSKAEESTNLQASYCENSVSGVLVAWKIGDSAIVNCKNQIKIKFKQNSIKYMRVLCVSFLEKYLETWYGRRRGGAWRRQWRIRQRRLRWRSPIATFPTWTLALTVTVRRRFEWEKLGNGFVHCSRRGFSVETVMFFVTVPF